MKLLKLSAVLCIGLLTAGGANAALVAADGGLTVDTDRKVTQL